MICLFGATTFCLHLILQSVQHGLAARVRGHSADTHRARQGDRCRIHHQPGDVCGREPDGDSALSIVSVFLLCLAIGVAAEVINGLFVFYARLQSISLSNASATSLIFGGVALYVMPLLPGGAELLTILSGSGRRSQLGAHPRRTPSHSSGSPCANCAWESAVKTCEATNLVHTFPAWANRARALLCRGRFARFVGVVLAAQ